MSFELLLIGLPRPVLKGAMMLNEKSETLVMLRLRDVLKRTGLSRSTIYNKLDVASPHYDAEFPRQIRVGRVSVRWIESEINSWMEGCVKLSRQNQWSMAGLMSAAVS